MRVQCKRCGFAFEQGYKKGRKALNCAPCREKIKQEWRDRKKATPKSEK